MGQTKRMSIVSSEDDPLNPKPTKSQ